MGRKRTPQEKLLIEERRKFVTEKLKVGLTFREIAEELSKDSRFANVGLSLGTVHSDVQVVISRWKEQQAQTYREKVSLIEARLDTLKKLFGTWQ